MTTLLFKTLWGRAGIVSLLLTLAPLCAFAASPKRILILDPFGHGIAPFSTALSGFRTTLAREYGERLEFYEISLEGARFTEPEAEGPFLEYLESRITNRPMDLVATIGGPGMDFVVRHHGRLFPDTPIVFIAGSPEAVQASSLQTNAVQVTVPLNLAGMVEDILQLQPQTTNIAVVFGASTLESATVNNCRLEFEQFTNRVAFTWLNDLSLEQVLERCATLPPRSFILHGLFLVDAAGAPYENNEPLLRLHGVANAPLYGVFASELGLGPIGGRLFQDTKLGVESARTAIRILHGEKPANIPLQLLAEPTPVYDWRELKRWGINEGNLPAGSEIRFREPAFWELHRWLIISTILFLIFQAALIVSLLFNRARRRQSETEATLIADISSRFVNLPPGEVDDQIMDAQRRLCQFLGFDFSTLWQWSDEDSGGFKLTHFFSAMEGPQPPDQMTQEQYPWAAQQLMTGQIIVVTKVSELPAEAARDRETLCEFGIKSNLVLPLSIGGEPTFGVLGLGTMQAERKWPVSLVKRMQLVAQIFANALARKRADQALRESEERMTLASEAANFGVWVWNIASNEIWGSARLLLLFGFEKEENITFEMILQRIHPDDRETMKREMDLAVTNQSDYTGEYCVVLPDGTERFIASRGRMHAATNGEPNRMLGAAIDITERRRADARFRLVVEASPNGIVLVNDQRRIVLVNTQTETLFGYTRPELIGQPLEILVPERSHDAHREYTAGFIASPQSRAMGAGRELFGRRKDGSEFPVEIGLSPIQTAEGSMVLAAISDITSRRQAESEVLRQRVELAHVARVSTMGELAASVAHELNQPLGAILANAEAAELFLNQDPPALDELHSILADIRKDDERAGEVIRRMRALLRKHDLERVPIEVNSLVQDVLQLVSGDAALREIQLTADLSPALPSISGDTVHLQQVILNLVINGMDAMTGEPPEKRRILVVTRVVADGQVELSVIDSGHGIEPEKLSRLFEAFYTTKPNGMGMGLSIARSIVEAHHGKILAENNVSGGASFRILLPELAGKV